MTLRSVAQRRRRHPRTIAKQGKPAVMCKSLKSISPPLFPLPSLLSFLPHCIRSTFVILWLIVVICSFIYLLIRAPVVFKHAFTVGTHYPCSRAVFASACVRSPCKRAVLTAGVHGRQKLRRQHGPLITVSVCRPQRSHAKYHISMQMRLYLLQCNKDGSVILPIAVKHLDSSHPRICHMTSLVKGVLIYILAYLKSTKVQIGRQLLDSGVSEELQICRRRWHKSDGYQAECR